MQSAAFQFTASFCRNVTVTKVFARGFCDIFLPLLLSITKDIEAAIYFFENETENLEERKDILLALTKFYTYSILFCLVTFFHSDV